MKNNKRRGKHNSRQKAPVSLPTTDEPTVIDYCIVLRMAVDKARGLSGRTTVAAAWLHYNTTHEEEIEGNDDMTKTNLTTL